MIQEAVSPSASPSLSSRCVAEVIGTFLLVFFGCGVVHAAVLTGAQSGLWQVAVVWGLGIAMAILAVGGISGAHLNPAVTVAMAVWRGFAWTDVGPYVVSQLAGAMLAASFLNVIFGPYLVDREHSLGIVRGEPGSEMSAMCYGEFYPDPGGIADAWRKEMARHSSDKRAEALRSFLTEERPR